jgi:phosphonate degradation associated HDIG domain protein
MPRPTSLEDIERLYGARGGLTYGEDVTQLEHAVQCASLAQAAGHPASLVVAALLHDIGHLFEDERDVVTAAKDRHHEIAGSQILSFLFGPEVCDPIAHHVAAKRYLCYRDTSYFDGLSAASKASLVLQGGPFDPDAAAAFEKLPFWQATMALRRFDDMGKRAEHCGRPFADFRHLLQRAAKT